MEIPTEVEIPEWLDEEIPDIWDLFEGEDEPELFALED